MRWALAHRHYQDFDRLKLVTAMLAPEPQFVRLHDEEKKLTEFFTPVDSPDLLSVSLDSVSFNMKPSEDTMKAFIHGQATIGEEQEPVELHWDLDHPTQVHVISIIPVDEPVPA